MEKNLFKVGDVVVVISDPAIRYTIITLYGNNDAFSICQYLDANGESKELSIPTVALKKYDGPGRGGDGNTSNQSFKRYVYFY